MSVEENHIRFTATNSSGEVSAIYLRPKNPKWLLVFAHGAGAGIHHRFMEMASSKLANRKIATLRFNFPYMENGRKSPDPQPILKKTIRSAVKVASGLPGRLPLLAGGKSLGGRMTSMTASEKPLTGVRGIVFFGFPLHAPGRPSSERADHLNEVKVPMLFLQGTRDNLADLNLLKPVCKKLGDKATIHIVEGGDHSFRLPKSAGKSDDEVLAELAQAVSTWSGKLPG